MRTLHRWKAAALAACLVLAGAGRLPAQETKPDAKPEDKPAAQPERKALDTAIYNTLRDVINRGADIYNPPASDWNGCHRLYEGALMAVKPLLAHRPDLQKAIDTGLASAARNPSMDRRAFDLRAVIDRVRDGVNPNPKKAATAGAKSLWDRLGGEAGVRKVVDDLVMMAAPDPKVNFFRGKPAPDAAGVAKLKKQLVDFVHDAAKAPDDTTKYYTGRSMKEAHKGMGITDAEFNALAGHLKMALEKNMVKAEDAQAVLDAVGGTRKDIVEGPKAPPDGKDKKDDAKDKKDADKKDADKKDADKKDAVKDK